MKLLLHTSWPLARNREIVVHRFPFVIGRRTNSDCSLSLPFISRRHCQFTRTGNQALVQDLGSFNGTFVNGKRATGPLPLQNGDELRLGPCVFRVFMLNDTDEAPAPGLGSTETEVPAARPSHAGGGSSMY